MNIDEGTAAWIETIVLGLVAAFLFQSGLLLLFFLVPLQFLWVKRGPNSYFVSGIVALAAILGAKLVQALRLASEQVDYVLLFADLLLPVAFIAGLYVLNAPLPWKLRRVYRLLAASAVSFVVTLPLVLYMAGSEVFGTAIRAQMAVLEGMLTDGSNSAPLFGSEEAQAAIVRLALDVFFGTYVAGMCMLLSLNWYVGHRIARRFSQATPEARTIRLPDTLVWPFVLALGAAALTLALDLGVLNYAIWNSALVLAFLYGIQGYAIARHLLDRFNVSRGVQFLIAVLAVMLLFAPGANLVIVIGLPGLGVSETWIRYNRSLEG